METVFGAPGPLLGEPMAEDVGGAAVDDRDLAMCPGVEPPDRAQVGRVEEHDLDSGIAHQWSSARTAILGPPQSRRRRTSTPSLAFVGQELRDSPTDLAGPPDVSLEVDGLAGRRDVSEETREEVAVVADLDGAAAAQRAANRATIDGSSCSRVPRWWTRARTTDG